MGMAAVKLKFLRSPTPGPERGGEAQAGGGRRRATRSAATRSTARPPHRPTAWSLSDAAQV